MCITWTCLQIYNLKAVIVSIVIEFNNCSVLVSNRLRLCFTNIYSIDDYKKQSLLFYRKYVVIHELIYSPTHDFTEEQILLLPFK